MNTIDNLITILGCGGHARSVADVILDNFPFKKIIFIDESALPDEMILGFKVFKTISMEFNDYFCAYGNNSLRKKMIEQYGVRGLANIISNNSHIGKSSKISKGIFVGLGSHIGPEVTIDIGTIINTNAVIEHETIIGSYCHIAPNATICGRCRIGNNVFIGAGSIIKDNISISANTTIGAGSVVVSDIVRPGIYTGAPAKQHHY